MNNKILYAIKTTKKYQERINSILETWISGIDDYIFYSDHEDLERNVILASRDSSYFGTLPKSLWFFNNLKEIFIDENNNILEYYEWVLFVDDDTFVNVENLHNFMKDLDDECTYGHLFTSQRNPDNPIWNQYKNILEESDVYFSGGAGFLIPTKVLKKINSFVDYGVIYDDATIGFNLCRNGVTLIHDDKFNPENPEFYDRKSDDIKNVISYHHITPTKMKELYEYLQ